MPDESNQALETLPNPVREALVTIVAEDPDAVEQFLVESGYLAPEDSSAATVDNRRHDEALSPPQTELRDRLTEMETSMSAEQAVEYLRTEHPEYVSKRKSAKHRSWLSQQLNDLVTAGELGRFRDGRTVRYTASTEDAIRNWARQNQLFIEDLDMHHLGDIIDETGMNRSQVMRVLSKIQSHSDK